MCAEQILRDGSADPVRVHEFTLDKPLSDIASNRTHALSRHFDNRQLK